MSLTKLSSARPRYFCMRGNSIDCFWSRGSDIIPCFKVLQSLQKDMQLGRSLCDLWSSASLATLRDSHAPSSTLVSPWLVILPLFGAPFYLRILCPRLLYRALFTRRPHYRALSTAPFCGGAYEALRRLCDAAAMRGYAISDDMIRASDVAEGVARASDVAEGIACASDVAKGVAIRTTFGKGVAYTSDV